jgi:predicted Zn-dependent protease
MNSRLPLIFAVVLFAWLAAAETPDKDAVHRPSLVAMAKQLRKEMLRSQKLLQNDSLEQYLTSLAVSLELPGELFPETLRVAVIKTTECNAFATPDGSIYICTGMLSRMDNEAQLAALIGHEMTHISKDHSVLQRTKIKKSTATKAQIQVGLGLLMGGFSGLVGNLTSMAAITGYSRELEQQADTMSFRRMMAKDFRPVEFRNLFLIIKKDIEDKKITESGFFSTHPKIVERIESYYRLAGKDSSKSSQGNVHAERFMNAVAEAFIANAEMNFRAGEYENALNDINKYLTVKKTNPQAMTLQGDIIRKRGLAGSFDESLRWYAGAIGSDSSYAPAYCKIGLLYYKQNECAKARPYFERYCVLLPQAYDREMILRYLSLCDQR